MKWIVTLEISTIHLWSKGMKRFTRYEASGTTWSSFSQDLKHKVDRFSCCHEKYRERKKSYREKRRWSPLAARRHHRSLLTVIGTSHYGHDKHRERKDITRFPRSIGATVHLLCFPIGSPPLFSSLLKFHMGIVFVRKFIWSFFLFIQFWFRVWCVSGYLGFLRFTVL